MDAAKQIKTNKSWPETSQLAEPGSTSKVAATSNLSLISIQSTEDTSQGSIRTGDAIESEMSSLPLGAVATKSGMIAPILIWESASFAWKELLLIYLIQRVQPLLSFSTTSTPCPFSDLVTSTCLYCAAVPRGLVISLSFNQMSARCLLSHLTITW